MNRTEARTSHGMTQFGRALCALDIEIICANSSQAKGRVERANGTLQDRLVKELRLAGICDIAAANTFLPGFIAAHHLRPAPTPVRSDDLHRPLNLPALRRTVILCIRDQRQVGKSRTAHYERRKFVLDDSALARSAIGKYVETYAYADRRPEIRWRGISLPYRVFDPAQQRVTHATITENKRLSETLAWVMAQRLRPRPRSAPLASSRGRYTPTGKHGGGRKGWAELRAERPARCPPASAQPPPAPSLRPFGWRAGRGRLIACDNRPAQRDISKWLTKRRFNLVTAYCVILKGSIRNRDGLRFSGSGCDGRTIPRCWGCRLGNRPPCPAEREHPGANAGGSGCRPRSSTSSRRSDKVRLARRGGRSRCNWRQAIALIVSASFVRSAA